MLKRLLSTLPLMSPLSTKKVNNEPYQARSVCFIPYSSFFNLYTLSLTPFTINPSNCSTYTFYSSNPWRKILFISIWKNEKFLWAIYARKIVIISNLATKAKVLSKYIHYSLYNPFTASQALFITMTTSSLIIFLKDLFSIGVEHRTNSHTWLSWVDITLLARFNQTRAT